MTKSRLQWCPTAEEVAEIVGELRPVIAAICDRQMAELEQLGAVFPSHPSNS